MGHAKAIRHLLDVAVICAAAIAGTWAGGAFCNWLGPSSSGANPFPFLARLDGAAPHAASHTSATAAGRALFAKGGVDGPNAWEEDGERPAAGRRLYAPGATRVAEVREDGSTTTEAVDPRTARRGFGATIRNALRRYGKAPKDQRDSRLTHDPFASDEHTQDGATVYPGDVFLTGIPMINQGSLAYCAVASAARVLQSYGIEISMTDMAVLARSSETGGTNLRNWEDALGKVAQRHDLELKVIPELTETTSPLSQLLYTYNQTARDMGYDELYTWNYVNAYVRDYKAFAEDREYPVQREVMLSNDRKCDAFEENVTARIDDSDPLFWSVTLGDVPEQTAYGSGTYQSGERSAHMRLIIGYNEDRGEVLYSDSWGEGHELKRMDAADALSITRGMYYLAD